MCQIFACLIFVAKYFNSEYSRSMVCDYLDTYSNTQEGSTPMYCAISGNHQNVVELLIEEYSVSPNDGTTYVRIISHHREGIVFFFCRMKWLLYTFVLSVAVLVFLIGSVRSTEQVLKQQFRYSCMYIILYCFET